MIVTKRAGLVLNFSHKTSNVPSFRTFKYDNDMRDIYERIT